MLGVQVLGGYRTIQLPLPAESLGLGSVNHSPAFDVVSSIWEVEKVSSLAAPSVVAVRVLVVYRAVLLHTPVRFRGLRSLVQ